MKLRTAVAAACFVAGLAGCASTPAVRVDKSDRVDVAKCQTFAWQPATQDAASFTEQRVRAAVMRQLEAKGYKQATENPDCRITYVLSVHERPTQKPRVGVGAGGGSGGVGGGIGVSIPIGKRDEHAGEFTLDVVDVASNSQIWSGSLDATFEAAEVNEEEAEKAVAAVLAELPDRTTQR
jgi:Domain of unknown function (DUF4136)